jgi:beta-glucuronidase
MSIYKEQTETIRKIPYIKGTSPWILFDFRCPRRHHYLQGQYNIKGLLSADKSHKKLSFYVMKEFYAGIDKKD